MPTGQVKRRARTQAVAKAPANAAISAGFSDVIAYHLRVAQESSFGAFSVGACSTDLRPGWYTLLKILADNPGLPPSELSRLCGRDRSTLTTTMKALDARGLIERQRNAEDQRSYSVRLTEVGYAMLGKLRTIADAHDARLDALVGADKPLFIAILRRIADRVGAAAND